jgi:Tfp pilus assembly protein PilN
MDVIALIAALAGLVTAIGSLVGSLVVLAKAREERKQIAAERARLEAETESLAKKSELDRALALIDQLQEDNDRLRTHLTAVEQREAARDREVTTLRMGIVVLINQLRALGVAPHWEPDWARGCNPVEGAGG